jgi:septal ring factor EnvC (AmiA/AmiB activator)
MAEISNDLLYEVMKAIQAKLAGVDGKIDELKQEMQAFRTHLIGVQQEISGIHATLVRHETPLDRIERRLELSESIPS